jgi:hypothetical protein
MKFELPIPERLKHLPVDERGYPIPYFVAIVNGKHDFRLLDAEKQRICCEYKKCAICGQKLLKGLYYFISGPMGAMNKVSTDPPMHKECAEFSLLACPHMFYEKADRRTAGLDELPVTSIPEMIMQKPTAMFMVQASSYKLTISPRKTPIIHYTPQRIYQYVYQDGTLHAVTA